MSPTTTTDRTDQLGELVDRHEIARLVDHLGAALDGGRFDDLPQIFTHDATARTPGGLAEGIDALIAQASRNHSPDDRVQHLVSGVLVDVDGDRADIRANLIVTFAGDDLRTPPRLRLGEVYRFCARRTADGWRLTSVQSTPVWAEGELPSR